MPIMFRKFQFRKLQFGESIKGKLFFETVRSYHISDNEILIGEKLMIFIHNIVYIMLSFIDGTFPSNISATRRNKNTFCRIKHMRSLRRHFLDLRKRYLNFILM